MRLSRPPGSWRNLTDGGRFVTVERIFLTSRQRFRDKQVHCRILHRNNDLQGQKGLRKYVRACRGGHEVFKEHGGHASRRQESGACRADPRSEEHTSELQSLMRISYAVFCLKKKNKKNKIDNNRLYPTQIRIYEHI